MYGVNGGTIPSLSRGLGKKRKSNKSVYNGSFFFVIYSIFQHHRGLGEDCDAVVQLPLKSVMLYFFGVFGGLHSTITNFSGQFIG